jgi:flagellar basal body-associated protein FliL
MAEEKKAAPAPQEPKGGGAASSIVSLVLTVVLAGGASFGGAKLGAAAHAAPHPAPANAPAPPPGPTVNMDPFLVAISEPGKPPHVIKLTIAVELKLGKKDEELKPFIPRLRDTTLGMLRALSFEEASSAAAMEEFRDKLLKAFEKETGQAPQTFIGKILITDFVTQ